MLLVLSVSGWWARNRNLGAETERGEALFVPLIAIEEAPKRGRKGSKILWEAASLLSHMRIELRRREHARKRGMSRDK